MHLVSLGAACASSSSGLSSLAGRSDIIVMKGAQHSPHEAPWYYQADRPHALPCSGATTLMPFPPVRRTLTLPAPAAENVAAEHGLGGVPRRDWLQCAEEQWCRNSRQPEGPRTGGTFHAPPPGKVGSPGSCPLTLNCVTLWTLS